jgi:hypothetical protein
MYVLYVKEIKDVGMLEYFKIQYITECFSELLVMCQLSVGWNS